MPISNQWQWQKPATAIHSDEAQQLTSGDKNSKTIHSTAMLTILLLFLKSNKQLAVTKAAAAMGIDNHANNQWTAAYKNSNPLWQSSTINRWWPKQQKQSQRIDINNIISIF